MTRAFSNTRPLNPGNGRQARASSGWSEIVEGTGQPCLTSGLAGTSGGGDNCGTAAGVRGNGEAASPPVHGCSSDEHAGCISSESIHTASRNFYHPARRWASPLPRAACPGQKNHISKNNWGLTVFASVMEAVFSLSTDEGGGKGRGEELCFIGFPSPQSSPRSFLAGRGRAAA